MDRMGLTSRQHTEYLDLISGPHDYDLVIDVLDMEERRKSSIKVLSSRGQEVGFIDGQVNLQRDGDVKRTATFNLYDPDRTLHLDNDSPFAGAVFADRMIRAAYVVHLPGAGLVRAVPFVGPITAAGREGDVLTLTCSDKTILAVEGCPPMTVRKGRNAVDAIHAIMADCTGERRFRFPKGKQARLTRSYSVGWMAEASPWAVCQKIASSINMQLVYACDGALLLRPRPRIAALTITHADAVARPGEVGGLTGPPRSDYDITGVRNIVRVTGGWFNAGVATAKGSHPLSPRRLGRHGVPRYLPELIEDSGIKKEKVAQRLADGTLERLLPMGVQASFPAIPLYHLDYGDVIRVKSHWGSASVPFIEGSLPLGHGGDATYGSKKVVSRPRRRF